MRSGTDCREGGWLSDLWAGVACEFVGCWAGMVSQASRTRPRTGRWRERVRRREVAGSQETVALYTRLHTRRTV